MNDVVHVERLSLMAEGSEEAVFRVDAGSCPDTGGEGGTEPHQGHSLNHTGCIPLSAPAAESH